MLQFFEKASVSLKDNLITQYWHHNFDDIVFVSPNGEKSLTNSFLSPDPDEDDPRGGPNPGYNTSFVKKIKSIRARVGVDYNRLQLERNRNCNQIFQIVA